MVFVPFTTGNYRNMIHRSHITRILCLGFIFFLCTSSINKIEWGFYGHKRINRMAVFTLPPEMIVFYKKNIEFITEHAVDPDKRRYATKHEGVRHYIDIDHWGDNPFEVVPENLSEAVVKYCDFLLFTDTGDTLHLLGNELNHSNLTPINGVENGYTDVYGKVLIFENIAYSEPRDGFMIIKEDAPKIFGEDSLVIPMEALAAFSQEHIMELYYEDEWLLDANVVNEFLSQYNAKITVTGAEVKDNFSEYGILPYHLNSYIERLTREFENGDESRILRLSAEIGHYIGDAHVPLHTSENYNGQFTDQDGIHGFWESRLPELFADDNYDFWVGKSKYINDPKQFFWNIVKESHSHLERVLAIEKELSETFPLDKQYCYETRNTRTIRTQCEEYATAFHEKMDGMVEKQMTESVHAIGSVWFTAWVNAGQPNMRKMDKYALTEEERRLQEEEEKMFKSGDIKGRKHDN
jgi:hypothetical protein